MDRWEITALLRSYHAGRRRRLLCMWLGHNDERPPGDVTEALCWCARCGRVASWWFQYNGVQLPTDRAELEPPNEPVPDVALQAARQHQADVTRVHAIVAAEHAESPSYTVERLDTPRDRIEAERRAIEA